MNVFSRNLRLTKQVAAKPWPAYQRGEGEGKDPSLYLFFLFHYISYFTFCCCGASAASVAAMHYQNLKEREVKSRFCRDF